MLIVTLPSAATTLTSLPLYSLTAVGFVTTTVAASISSPCWSLTLISTVSVSIPLVTTVTVLLDKEIELAFLSALTTTGKVQRIVPFSFLTTITVDPSLTASNEPSSATNNTSSLPE